MSVVMNFRVGQGLGIFIPTEYHWFHKKDSLLWRHFGQSKLSRVPAQAINPLTPNYPYKGRTAPLTSKRCILYVYSTNIGTEYFKHGIYSSFFFLFKMQLVL